MLRAIRAAYRARKEVDPPPPSRNNIVVRMNSQLSECIRRSETKELESNNSQSSELNKSFMETSSL